MKSVLLSGRVPLDGLPGPESESTCARAAPVLEEGATLPSGFVWWLEGSVFPALASGTMGARILP